MSGDEVELELELEPLDEAVQVGRDDAGLLEAVGEDCHGSQSVERLEYDCEVDESQDSAAAGDSGDQAHVPVLVRVMVEQPQPDSAPDSPPDTTSIP